MGRGNVARRLSTRSVANRVACIGGCRTGCSAASCEERILAKGGKAGRFLTQVKAQRFLLPYNEDKGTVKVEI